MKKVLITREAGQFEEIRELFLSYNLEPVSFPVIKFTPLDFEFDENNFDYIIFTSSNAVRYFLSRIKPSKPKLIAVGEKTAKTVRGYGYTDVITPDEFSAEGLLNHINQNRKEFEGKKLALVRAADGIDTLIKQKPEFIQLELIKVYKTEHNTPENKAHVRQLLEKGKIDFVIFSSPSTVEGFLKIFSDGINLLRNTKIAVIGKTTEKTLKSHGINATLVPDKFTFEEIAKKISKYT